MRPRTAQVLRGPACTLCDVIKFGYFQHVRSLIASGLDIECRDGFKRTPLILCALMEPEEWGVSIAMTLIEQGAAVGRTDRDGRSALHYACIYEREQLVAVLLQAPDFELSQADGAGNTALHYAAMAGHWAIARRLVHSLRRYKLRLDKLNLRGNTAVDEALLAGNTRTAHVIQHAADEPRAGADVSADRVSECPSRVTNSVSLLKKRKILRPKSALTSRDFPADSSNGVRTSVSFSRPKSSHTPRRKAQRLLYSLGIRNEADVIVCAGRDDFRNTAEYVFKLVHLPHAPENGETVSLASSSRQSASRWTDSSSHIQSQYSSSSRDWRGEFKVLFQVYESQCSASWRLPKQPEVAPETHSLQPEVEVEEKKGRRQSIASRCSSNLGLTPRPRGKQQRKIMEAF
ncbi:uncharacterized protein LOC131957307 [Physella acuta]|uniref:uncharacterized protein LOC131957307 n=1 Tax=Physella acuta TaxID=109671 RepID=UPI0027DC04BB|nr:uncharacterized protein LOC131957307 [Physella acuta]XP_059178028.1 uncharacterized protein LOC131957307 [Physella acuta]XP_059178037.1 uncharacterized protein LOC131957307 [Physella acuta]